MTEVTRGQDGPKIEPKQTKTTTSLLTDALSQISSLVRSEVDLARAEVSENISHAGTAIGLLAAAGIIALTALNVLAAALVAALTNTGLGPAWSAIIVGLIFAGIAYALSAKGINDLKISSLAPTRTATNIKRDAEAVKETL